VLEAQRQQLDGLLRPHVARDPQAVAVVGAGADGVLAAVGDLPQDVVALDLAQQVAAAGEAAGGVAQPLARGVAAPPHQRGQPGRHQRGRVPVLVRLRPAGAAQRLGRGTVRLGGLATSRERAGAVHPRQQAPVLVAGSEQRLGLGQHREGAVRVSPQPGRHGVVHQRARALARRLAVAGRQPARLLRLPQLTAEQVDARLLVPRRGVERPVPSLQRGARCRLGLRQRGVPRHPRARRGGVVQQQGGALGRRGGGGDVVPLRLGR
jgi:hypothetical protein